MARLDDPRRLAKFSGPILQLDADGELEDCVKEASTRADSPLALVTFVMSKIQLFRAAVGLPPELDASRATSRCDSFCQFVVESDEPFIVTDAKNDARVPQTMVERYGIMAYLGVPIHVGGQPLGSLCVADATPRTWSPGLVDELAVIAARVSARLEEMSTSLDTEPPPKSPRTLAADVADLVQVIERSLVEVGPMVRLAKSMAHGIPPEALARAMSVLTEATDFYDDMMAAVGELRTSSARLERATSSPPQG
jgi:signal transduction protein with GAF and PtsI domain